MILPKKNFLTLLDYTSAEVEALLHLAAHIKKHRLAGTDFPFLRGKCLALVFQQPSNRTRISFEVGTYHLGGNVVYLKPSDIHMGDREPIADIARVMTRYLDGVLIRTLKHEDIEEFARHCAVPVINGLSNKHHPCQALSDFFTISEIFGRTSGIKIAFMGDGNNVCASLVNIASLLGSEVILCAPEGYEIDPTTICADYRLVRDPRQAVKDADVIYTDVWTSMGQEAEKEQRIKAMKDFQVNADLLTYTKPGAVFMHCLPAHRGEEVTAEVMESSMSVVFHQAENRLHAQKAILAALMGDSNLIELVERK